MPKSMSPSPRAHGDVGNGHTEKKFNDDPLSSKLLKNVGTEEGCWTATGFTGRSYWLPTETISKIKNVSTESTAVSTFEEEPPKPNW